MLLLRFWNFPSLSRFLPNFTLGEWLNVPEYVVIVKISAEPHFERVCSNILGCANIINISTDLHFQRECSYILEFDVVITISKELNLEWAWSYFLKCAVVIKILRRTPLAWSVIVIVSWLTFFQGLVDARFRISILWFH